MITLYGPAQTPYTEKVRRALIYKGYDFRLVEPETPEDYKRWSPKTGTLPALDLRGEHVPDSTEILFRIDRDRPDPPLLSSDPTIAAQQRQLEDWADESFLFYYVKYRRVTGNTEMVVPVRADREAAAARPARRSGPLRRFAAWVRAGGTWERPETAILREIGMRMDDLVNFLGARPYFYSQRLSMGDLAVYAMLWTIRNGSIPGAGGMIALRPSLVAFMQRVEAATGGSAP